MLSYKDSKRLKELGYLQELKEGDWYYRETRDGKPLSPEVPELQVICSSCAWDSAIYELYPPYYVKVPTTDGMIEGLGEHLLSIKVLPDGYSLLGVRSGHIQGIIGGNLKEALCKLWESVSSSLVTTLSEEGGEGRIFSENVRKEVEGVIEELVRGQTGESGSLLLPRGTLISMTVNQIEEILEKMTLLSE